MVIFAYCLRGKNKIQRRNLILTEWCHFSRQGNLRRITEHHTAASSFLFAHKILQVIRFINFPFWPSFFFFRFINFPFWPLFFFFACPVLSSGSSSLLAPVLGSGSAFFAFPCCPLHLTVTICLSQSIKDEFSFFSPSFQDKAPNQ